jgi:hypothetical protein
MALLTCARLRQNIESICRLGGLATREAATIDPFAMETTVPF